MIVSKLSVSLYSREERPLDYELTRRSRGTSASSSYATPLDSPLRSVGAVPSPRDLFSRVVKLTLDVDAVSLTLDVRERFTDVAVKVGGVEGLCSKRVGGAEWKPLLPSGKLFSSRGSTLPAGLSQLVAHTIASEPLREPLATMSRPSPVKTGGTVSHHRNFVILKVKVPRRAAQLPPSVVLRVQPFEVVAWLPAVSTALSVLVPALPHTPTTGARKVREWGGLYVVGEFWRLFPFRMFRYVRIFLNTITCIVYIVLFFRMCMLH